MVMTLSMTSQRLALVPPHLLPSTLHPLVKPRPPHQVAILARKPQVVIKLFEPATNLIIVTFV